ncbi:transposase [Thermospira aquatica]|uniref:Mutator family transposase n=1 Tax=Thermospira aquatica TaxID=2828656 RepID=A0AAX3BAD1_9SPIR|nr:transposase [Thermospira aquatica]URA09090.1 transposase [Thermospira aquatica]
MIETKNILELFKPIVKEVLESMLKEEREIYLENNPPTKGNGFYERDLKTAFGELTAIRVPRTRDNGFKSALLPYRKRITEDLDALIRAMLISGMSTRKIAEVLKELYEIKISYDNISRISQVGIEEIQKWRSRPLMEEYAVVFLDAMVFPIKRDRVENESIYVAIGITPEGRREILGYYLPGRPVASNKKVLEIRIIAS